VYRSALAVVSDGLALKNAGGAVRLSRQILHACLNHKGRRVPRRWRA
jgi:hypothetical protein